MGLVSWKPVEGKLRWEGCQGVSTGAVLCSVLRQTCSKLKLDSGSSSETPMAYSFEPIQVALQRLPVMILTLGCSLLLCTSKPFFLLATTSS